MALLNVTNSNVRDTLQLLVFTRLFTNSHKVLTQLYAALFPIQPPAGHPRYSRHRRDSL